MTPNQEFANYNEFVSRFWFYKPGSHGGVPELAYVALGIAGESGEVCEKIKKVFREKHGIVEDPKAILKELGDLYYYVVKAAQILGYTQNDIEDANFEKLISRRDRGVLRGSGDDR